MRKYLCNECNKHFRLTELLGSAKQPNLTEPVSSAKPEPERFGLLLVDKIFKKVDHNQNMDEIIVALNRLDKIYI